MKKAVEDPPAPAPIIATVFEALYHGLAESIVNALLVLPNHNQDGSRNGRLNPCTVPTAARIHTVQRIS